MSAAKEFQRLVLPSVDDLKTIFPRSFVYYQPKEEVGGDFYWLMKDDVIILVAADCTGHGITGSYVHFLGHAFLTEIVSQNSQTNPARILQELDRRMRATSQKKGQTGEMNAVGMDAAVLRIYSDQGELDFCGANLPCYIVRNGKLIHLPKTKRGIGSINHLPDTEFTTLHCRVEKGDMIYLFSDGYADQFGGTEDKKIGNLRFTEALIAASYLPVQNQRAHLRKFFDDWKDGADQTDDVMVLGIQI